MELYVKRLQMGGNRNKEALEFSHSLDLSHLSLWGEKPFPQPVKVHGSVFPRADILVLEYTAEYTLSATCARCLEPVQAGNALSFSHVIVEKLEDDGSGDEYLLAPGGILDLDGAVAADLLLAQAGVPYCSPDCQGLCPKCGINRNTGSCDCTTHLPDSRFDALRELLQNDD